MDCDSAQAFPTQPFIIPPKITISMVVRMAAGNQGVDQFYGWNEINHKVRYTQAQANCYQGDYEYNQ